jgi:hypothetical protein
MSRQAVNLARPDGLILVEDEMAQFAIRYQIVCRKLHDVEWARVPARGNEKGMDALARLIVKAAASRRPVVLVPLDVTRVRTPCPVGEWTREGDLYVLTY